MEFSEILHRKKTRCYEPSNTGMLRVTAIKINLCVQGKKQLTHGAYPPPQTQRISLSISYLPTFSWQIIYHLASHASNSPAAPVQTVKDPSHRTLDAPVIAVLGSSARHYSTLVYPSCSPLQLPLCSSMSTSVLVPVSRT